LGLDPLHALGQSGIAEDGCAAAVHV
jgi:hypothetical protein